MRNAATLIGAGAAVAGALAVLTGVHDRVSDTGADVVLVASLLGVAREVFRLVDADVEDPPQPPADRAR